VNTQLAFQYLQKAAEHAVDDLNNMSSVNMSASKGELVMAIYELGVSFRHGWGVHKDKKTACYYFKIAAELVRLLLFMAFASCSLTASDREIQMLKTIWRIVTITDKGSNEMYIKRQSIIVWLLRKGKASWETLGYSKRSTTKSRIT
jgi:hypothetical protein